MTCPCCTEPVADDFEFCPACGANLGADPAVPADFAPPAPALPPLPLASRTSAKAIGSLVCGIFWVCGLGSIAALLLGYLALKEIRRNPLQIVGKGMAIAGIILGWVGVAGLAFVITLGVHVWKEQRDHQPKPHMRQADITVAERGAAPRDSVCRRRS